MSAWVVADSGIFIATVLPETYSTHARQLVNQWSQQGIQVAAPTLFRYEIVAVTRKAAYRGIITPAESIKRRDILMVQPVELMMNDDLLRRGFELATQFNRPTAYDSQYLAVAEHLGCEFWTADERLFNAVSQTLNWVKWLGHFTV